MNSAHQGEPRIRRSPSGLLVVEHGEQAAGGGASGASQLPPSEPSQPSPPEPSARKNAWPSAELAAMARQDKLVRLGVMIRQLCAELREMTLDENAQARLAVLYDRIAEEIAGILPPELRQELHRLRPSLDARPTRAELRVVHAQLLGWLEGLSHGVQVALSLHRANLVQQYQALRSGTSGGGTSGARGPAATPQAGSSPPGLHSNAYL
ncbi:unnamed protein product [[Actinomadura] parvosata subsp. kistnae]|nr:proteasome activator [Nonomuraea sp. ATCC 55076]SPL91284.1 unnamed protein product [Actinomadura parvosata subsp. kistnae]